MKAKRIFDLCLAIPGLIILSPFFLIIMLWIKLDSSGSVFFRQERVGRFGKTFRIYKFRTMTRNAEKMGKQITVGNDSRITRCGSLLRKFKIDELPQLINVIKGDMSLVGPRPEVPYYVEKYPADYRQQILAIPPGITDFASIAFKDESVLLSLASDPEKEYVEKIMKIKIRYYLRYAQERSLMLDLKIIVYTVLAILGIRPKIIYEYHQEILRNAFVTKPISGKTLKQYEVKLPNGMEQ